METAKIMSELSALNSPIATDEYCAAVWCEEELMPLIKQAAKLGKSNINFIRGLMPEMWDNQKEIEKYLNKFGYKVLYISVNRDTNAPSHLDFVILYW